MLYNLLVPLSDIITPLNIFRYITFRATGAMFFSLVITIIMGPYFIRLLRRLKYGQQIHEDIKNHSHKAGIPTMGGVLIYVGTVLSVLFFADLSNNYIWLTLYVFTGFGVVGLIDDMSKIYHRKNRGISAKTKILGQSVVAISALILLINEPAYSSTLSVPFLKTFAPNLGLFYIVFASVVIVGSSNAVNLTDGLDGLAILPVVVCIGVYSIFIYVTGHVRFAEYLQLTPIYGIGEVVVFCGALMGAGLGFLWYNAQPAELFMGDVGSLSLGGVIGFLAVLCKQELILVVAGGIFVIETLSVTIQVLYFRSTKGKRFFRMAPLHHHFELKGWAESKIIIRFWILSVLFALVSLSILKLR